MFSIFQTDDKIQSNEKKFQELLVEFEQQEAEVDILLKEVGITSKQAETYLSNKQNFSHAEWEELERRKKGLDEKLKRDLENIRDPLKLKKKYAERQIDPRWLHVR